PLFDAGELTFLWFAVSTRSLRQRLQRLFRLITHQRVAYTALAPLRQCQAVALDDAGPGMPIGIGFGINAQALATGVTINEFHQRRSVCRQPLLLNQFVATHG